MVSCSYQFPNLTGLIIEISMKYCIALIVFLTLSLTKFTLGQSTKYEIPNSKHEVYFFFRVGSISEINNLAHQISIDNVRNDTVWAYAGVDEFIKFLHHGYDITLLPSPGDYAGIVMNNNIQLSTLTTWNFYPTYEAYENLMAQFQSTYPGICQVTTIATLASGRKLLVAKISDNVNTDESEPEFLYTSSIHGDETTGYILMLHLIDYLLSNYGTNSEVTDLVNNLEIFINPLANPDGTYHDGNSSIIGATHNNANNVDLNGNFPDPQDGQHPDGNSWQPETVAFMNFASQHHLVASAGFHGGSEVVNYPWDTWAALHPDNDLFNYVSREYADTVHIMAGGTYMTYLNSGVTNGYAWYRKSGGRQDYMNYFQHCKEYTIELSNTKLLPANQLEDHWNYNWRSLLLILKEARYGIHGMITNSCTGVPVAAKVFVTGHDANGSECYSSANNGDYHRLIKAGTYTLEFSAPNYQTHTVTGVVVTDHNTVNLDVQLIPTSNIITNSISSITGTSAISGGNILCEGGSGVIVRGVCWATTNNPTISGNHSSDGSLTGNYTSAITGLSPLTLYHVRAYFTNGTGTYYGNDVIFSTLIGIPVVTTAVPSVITSSAVTSGGTVVSEGASGVTARGVCWSISANPGISGSHTTNGSGIGSFTSNISGLNSNTTYHTRSFATNSFGTAYGSDISFKTSCDLIANFPWNEGFENGGTLPACWSQEQIAGSGINWTFIEGNGNGNPSTAHGGAYNACLKDLNNADTKTRLILPPFNLAAIANPQLKFWHTQTEWSNEQDQLAVFYKTSAFGTWTQLAIYTNNVPAWTQETIDLPNAGSEYYIAFEGNAKYGYGVCIDDVSVSAAPSVLNVSPSNQMVSALAGSTNFSVTSNTVWTVVSNQSWCTVNPGGSGNGTIMAEFTQNTTGSARSAEVTVTVPDLTPVVVTITQAAPTLTVTPSNQAVPDQAGSTSIEITSNSNWVASSDQIWCSLNPTSGNGNGSITANYSANTTASQRIANITVTVAGLPPVVTALTQESGSTDKILNLSLYLQGLYVGSGMMHPAMDASGNHWGETIADHITVELHDGANYPTIIYSAPEINLNINGSASVPIPSTFSGSYYITIRHRNSIETVSTDPVSFSGSEINYSFTDQLKAAGGKLIQEPDGIWSISSGDVDQNGKIEAADMILLDADASGFASGYLSTDINGDGIIDALDLIIADNNLSKSIEKPIPEWCSVPYFALPERGIDLTVGVQVIVRGDALINVPIQNNLTVEYICDIGTQSGNDFILDPAVAGTHLLTIQFKNNGVVFLTKTVNLNVYASVPSNNIKLLRVGDSTNGSDEISESIQSVVGNCSITYLGTQGGLYKHEGWPGFTFQAFVSEDSPFYFSGALNIPQYFAVNNIATPDYVDIRVGINDMYWFMTTGLNDDELNEVLGYAKMLISGFLNYDNHLKVIVSFPSICENSGSGWQNNYPGNPYQDDYIRVMHKFWTGLKNEFDQGAYNSRVFISSDVIFLDRNDGYPKVNGVHVNGVHPNTAGLIQIGTGLGVTLNAEGMKAKKPTALALSWLDDYANIDFQDQSNGECQFEIWESVNGGPYTLVTTLDQGISSYHNYTYQGAEVSVKVRAKYGVWYSDFTDEVSISTPLVIKTVLATAATIAIPSIVLTTDTVKIFWGDGDSTFLLPGNNQAISHSYTSSGTFYVSITSNTNDITTLDIHGVSQFVGDLTKWLLPANIINFIAQQCTFTKIPPVDNSGINLFNFSSNLCSTSDVDSWLTDLNSFYALNPPTNDATFYINGASMGAPTNGNNNADRLAIIAKFQSVGKTATIVNSN